MMMKSGWIPDPPDPRDYTVDHRVVRPFVESLGIAEPSAALPDAVDLRAFFPPVIDQNPLNSCTAATAAAIMSYFQRKAHDRQIEPSVLFLYKVTRNLLGLRGDSGALLRTSMHALRLFGVLPEQRWPYDPALVDVEPDTFHYLFAANYKAKAYYRLDTSGVDGEALLARLRTNLAAQLPAMFGLFAFPSLAFAAATGAVPYPARGERPTLSHALVAVGYDDGKEVRNPIDGVTRRGALRVRNSWGPQWGEAGYGWLPYAYILNGLTSDWWSVVEADFVDEGQFGFQ
ncbi:Papain family cysteine protease [Luteitalea pratensis]|uniref:Papain family cysteine protease n=1 Tax=Luteitalea pratensis TaxID=1855912 RepID=A0A143PLH3_LUTPR|nr:Papain family cysteine protease [Luteitalea pratensis]